MPRVVTFGRMPDSLPEGQLCEVYFPELAKLDVGTNEGWVSRVLSSDGGDVRTLPRTISFQEWDTFGHDQAAAVGSVWEVTVDGETGIMSGRGFIADSEIGRRAAFAAFTKALHHNSIDLSEVTKVSYEEEGDYWSDDFHVTITFEEWKMGKTTLVALPAFADARMETVDWAPIAASLETGPLVIEIPSVPMGHSAMEIVAGMATRPNRDHFYVPEPDTFQAITVGEPDEAGWIPVSGHLADWNALHKNAMGQYVHPPRPTDGYAHYNSGKVLTDQGFVGVGPITLLGGHVTLQQAIEDIANTWADVRMNEGKLGPWCCGVVRPHVAADLAKTYAARASQVSGYWPDGKTLRLVSSVSAAGFPVLEVKDGEFALAASLVVEEPEPALAIRLPEGFKSFAELTEQDKEAFRSMLQQTLGSAPVAASVREIHVDIEYVEPEELADQESLEQAAIEERARILTEGPLAELFDDE